MDIARFGNRGDITWGPVYTKDHKVGAWKMAFFYGPTLWSNFRGMIS